MCRAIIPVVFRRLRWFGRDTGGTSAVEFALVSFPLILILLMILQMGIYYMTKSSLDTGVDRTADDLVNTFNSGTASTFPGPPTATNIPPSIAQVKADILAKSGGLISASTILVDLASFATLSAANVNVGSALPYTCFLPTDSTVLELRAQSPVPFYLLGFLPGASSPVVQSAALVRLQGKCG